MIINLNHKLSPLALAGGVIAALIAGVAMAGWLVNEFLLASFSPQYIPMAPSTGLAFIVLSGALCLYILRPAHPWGRLGARGGALLVFLGCLLILGQFMVGSAFDVEQWLYRIPGTLGAVPLARMSPLTAGNFLLAAGALWGLWASSSLKERAYKVTGILSLGATSVGLVVAFGYLHETPLLYGGATIPVALTTGLAFVFLGLGVIAALGPDYWPLRPFWGPTVRARLLRVFLPFTLAVIFVHDLIEIFIRRQILLNPALVSAWALILSVLIIMVIVSRIAQVLGGDIDRAEAERRQAEEALAERERLLQMIFDAEPECVKLLDQNGTVLQINRAGLIMAEADSPEQVIGKSFYSVVAPEYQQAFRMLVDSGFAGEPGSMEYELIGLKGTRRWQDTHAVPLRDHQGVIIALLAVTRDTTERKSLEAQLVQAQKMEAVGTLAGGVAHDFNNLLTAMMGNLELAKMKLERGQGAEEHLGEMENITQRAATLTNQLLAFSRRQIIQPVPLDLNDTITEMSKMLPRLIGEHITLEFRLEGNLGVVNADPGQLEQVIMNLCVNARDAMPTGGKLLLTTGNIRLEEDYINHHPWVEKGDYVLLEVADSGCGMDEATLQRIFEPFFTTKEVGKGTGLGLSMVYGIVKQHQGYIHVYSEPGRGTTFKIYLPRTEEKAAAQEVRAAPEKAKGGRETILLAEDEEQLRGAISNILEMFGYTVLTAPDGQEAVEIYEQDKERIDLVILDAVMPKMGGMEAAKHIYELNPSQKILFSSGYSAEGLHNSFIVPENMHFIQKPYRANELAQKIREVLEGK